MNKALKIVFASVFFALLALPTLHYFGVKEDWTPLYGWERKVGIPELTFAGFTNRTYQAQLTEEYSKYFFLRKTFLKTTLQWRDWLNLEKFHYGYSASILEGPTGVLFERPYTEYHLEGDNPLEPKKYAEVMKTIHEIDDWCKTNGADFIYVLIPDKEQVYQEYLPTWFHTFWNYQENDIQGKMEAFCAQEGIRTFNARRFFLDAKTKTDQWLYPPAGTHINALGNAILVEAIVKRLSETGGAKLKLNPFKGATPIDHMWNVDDDIGNLLNLWDTKRVDANVRYTPHYAQTNVVMNAGGVILFGDCYREQIGYTMVESGLFAKDKVVVSKRFGEQKPEGFKNVAVDLKLVCMVFQSFNTGRLDGRNEEIRSIFKAIKDAREEADKRK